MTKRKHPRILTMGGGELPIERAGAKTLYTSTVSAKAREAIEAGAVDGLLLTGGNDIDPLLYAEERHPRAYGFSPKRDQAEWEAITAADARGIPILGICRGAQMLNVAYGGTLHQHLPDVEGSHDFHWGGDHRVRAAEGSRLATAWGNGKDATRWVISIHHQAVDQVASGWVATGWSLDGTIETIERVDGWAMGVQFHPEMDHKSPHAQRIFDRFVAAAAHHAKIGWKLPKRPDTVPVPVSKGGWNIETDSVWRQPKPKPKLEPVPAKRRREAPSWQSPVLTRWRCFRCGIDFDERADHVDHMLYIHGLDTP